MVGQIHLGHGWRYSSPRMGRCSCYPENYPDVDEFFSKGFFSFKKGNRQFSQIGLDQVHEQNNAVIKGAGGASDLLNKVDESALLRWEVCNPEVAGILLEFEDGLQNNPQVEVSPGKHQEDNEAFRFCHESIPTGQAEKA